ncbi:HotDog domain-containing protein [Aspergillus cavernicola]|uniref:HotDog domain-containing protein n=1 Tax=Aspergillus cavernicola TaxID=176166 RepID=A0ABR4IR15_9EURO
MSRLRQVLQPRLFYAATQSRPISQSFPRASIQYSTITHQRTSKPLLWLRRLLYAGFFGNVGVYCAYYVDAKINHQVPLSGSEEDEAIMERLNLIHETGLDIVKKLREDPAYIETDVYGNYSGEEKDQRLTSGPLAGSRGIALQKIFWNHKEKKAINVVYLGEGLDGWPTTVHGGALATVLDEHLARVAIQNLPERTAVTANLDVNYRKKALSGSFYTVHAMLDQERSTDRKAYVRGEVRNMRGHLCVEASGLFVVPRGYQLRRLGDAY